jgi:hypothetical protein
MSLRLRRQQRQRIEFQGADPNICISNGPKKSAEKILLALELWFPLDNERKNFLALSWIGKVT